MSELRCELCSGDKLAEVYMPDASGAMTVRCGLYVCEACRIVIQPRPNAGGIYPGRRVDPPDLKTGWTKS